MASMAFLDELVAEVAIIVARVAILCAGFPDYVPQSHIPMAFLKVTSRAIHPVAAVLLGCPLTFDSLAATVAKEFASVAVCAPGVDTAPRHAVLHDFCACNRCVGQVVSEGRDACAFLQHGIAVLAERVWLMAMA